MNSQFEVRDLRFFIAVAEELHFGRAAGRLHIAQPHLSANIRRLEDRLGVKLLDRTTRSVRLTKAGEQFKERAKYALAQIDEAVACTRLFADGRAGRLRIGFTPAAAFEVLPSILSEFRRNNPDVGLALSYKDTALQIQDLVDGRLDLGFLRLPVHTRRLATLTVAREGVVAAVPRNHPLATRASLLLEDLADHEFIQFASVPGVDFQEHVVSYCGRAGFRPRVAFEASDTHSILAMVAAGFGVAILPEWVRKASYSRIVFKSLQEIPPLVDLALAWIPQNRSPAIQSFKYVVDDHLKRHPLD
jgi:DNA-binding transcriptional LysR family regulator